MVEDASMDNCLSPEELKERYMEAKRFTSGVVFGVGDGYLGPVVSTGRGDPTQQSSTK